MAYLAPKVLNRISKEVAEIQKQKIEDISLMEVSDLRQITGVIQGPQGTPYEGGSFAVSLTFCEEFPQKPPKGVFLTKIFHPNVAPKTGDICVNTLKRDWQSNLGILHVLMVIRCLMIEPNPDSALNADAGRLIQENYEAYVEKARLFTELYARSGSKKNPEASHASAGSSNGTSFSTKSKTLNANTTLQDPESSSKENNKNSGNVQSRDGKVMSSSCKMSVSASSSKLGSNVKNVQKKTTTTTKRSTLKRL